VTTISSRLPEFDEPPVSEVALAVEFLPLMHWRSAHAGRYWARVGADYPQIQEMPPLLSQIERFGDELRQAQFAPPHVPMQMLDPTWVRSWLISSNGTNLIQVQRDRFIVNWRRSGTGEKYPRYQREMRPRFEREWRNFQEFVSEIQLGPIAVQQCEVTYVNYIYRGIAWDSLSEGLSLFSYWSGGGSAGFLSAPESINLSGSFIMPNDIGRLHFTIQRVVVVEDQKEAIQFTLSARGRPETADDHGVLKWMDLGREWIVRGFTDLTTKKAHDIWRMRK
jgi:uncharacterized protein (TIGR04255 family)